MMLRLSHDSKILQTQAPDSPSASQSPGFLSSPQIRLFRVPGSQEEQGFMEISQTKSKRVRRVPLAPELLKEVRQKVGRLVPYAVGSPGSFTARVRRWSGIEEFHVHQTRHTFACQWLERGGSLAALQQVLGHASIVTTQRYAKLTDEAVMREAGRLPAPLCFRNHVEGGTR